MKKVTIIYRTIPQYRVEFYNQLKAFLLKQNIQLQLIYGDNGFQGRNDSVDLPWATFIKNSSVQIGDIALIWQPCLSLLRNSDLVIVEQANMLLINYLLILRRVFFQRKFAFWGHGQNLQVAKDGLYNKFKMTYINQSSWWFPYTEGVKRFLIEKGVKMEKITVVQNAIDTHTLRAQYLSFADEEIAQLRLDLGIDLDEKVLIYCGALSREKNLSFLLESIIKLRKLYSKSFKLLILGSGPEQLAIENFVKNIEYITYLGPKYGIEKAKYFRLADIFVLPGAMGLAVLDAFAYETPIVTIEFPFHGPEIEYIKNHHNGFIAKNDICDFNDKVLQLMQNTDLRYAFKAQGLEALKTLNIETMVQNFGNGILACLSKN
ncbi:Glycosyltransferase involved in cell wall bisynthesis [Belliella buryatensis]|uniref:Glycosyltransferase involved in cell wall bisynthesis n=1 Tax=Belliella buryatensis TaxID=1500549 RepID=A0A239BHX5_9BACT|nr:glycosyltransferase family 4 protein [Belliella buryatensis]SNS07580.1 Glycosyltransferase involved in cell wall bisynthesis [Belliella buryatensis]